MGWFSRKRNLAVTAGAAVVVAAGVSVGLAATSGSPGGTTASAFASPGHGPLAGGSHSPGAGSNARSGPEPGGTSGTVTSVAASGFTVTTTDGQKVTVNETSSTVYDDGSASTTASAIATDTPVLVLGTVDSTAISATQVTIEPADSPYTTANPAVAAFQQGSPSASKTVGAVPSDYTEGQGTLVTGTAADHATEAALAAYPGVLVDRVVRLGDGEYEVHTIGANWPHHVFVSAGYQVLGAD